MPWNETPTTGQRPITTGLPGASGLEAAGYPLDWLTKLRLGFAKLMGQLQPVEEALPKEMFGVPVQGQQRMADLVEFLSPFLSRKDFGKNPQDADDLLDAFQKRIGGTQGETASNLVKVYRKAVARNNLFEELGEELPEEEEPAKGLQGVQMMRNQR